MRRGMQRLFRRTALWMALVLVGSLLGIAPAARGEDAPKPAGEVLIDLNFDDGSTQNFQIYTNGGSCDISNAEGQLAVDIHKCGSLDYANQVYWDGFSLEQGGVYVYSFDVSCDLERQMEYRLQINGGDYHAYVGDVISVGPEPRTIEVEFTMEEDTDPAPRLCFNMGKAADMTEDPGEHRILFDNILLTLKEGSGIASSEEEEETLLACNQLGYRPGDPKRVFCQGSPAEEFSVVRCSDGAVVLTKPFGDPVEDASAGAEVRTGDFSELTEEGEYFIQISAEDFEYGSASFRVAEDVYEELFGGLVRMLTLQRCGCELPAELAGSAAHGACHTEEALIYGKDRTKEVSGGWHDAGDYGRYVVPGAKAVQDLLLAFEDWGITSDALGIPESGNGTPDLLDEARYELEWMRKMQEEESGGVYHKVSGRNFPGEVFPQEETEQLVLAPISTAATADFAAVMARASLVYRPYDAAFADEALAAAKKAWEYVTGRDQEPFHNPSDIVTGEYPDEALSDELFWAAAELAIAGDEEARAYLTEHPELPGTGLGWQEVGGYALYDLAVRAPEGLGDLQEACGDALKAAAEGISERGKTSAFGIALGETFPWGSNMSVANDGMILQMAARLAPEKAEAYGLAARAQFDYLLGANATGYSFVTGFGSQTPEHPHHRPSQAAGEAVPGMLVGGPDNALEDPYAQNVLAGKAPALCYADSDQSYSTNEVTIYWNSPFICLAAGVCGESAAE